MISVNKARAVQLIMHTCSLVQIGHLQDKLTELIPIAESAISLDNQDASIKLTALQLFRKILIADDKNAASIHLDTFLPFIL